MLFPSASPTRENHCNSDENIYCVQVDSNAPENERRRIKIFKNDIFGNGD